VKLQQFYPKAKGKDLYNYTCHR